MEAAMARIIFALMAVIAFGAFFSSQVASQESVQQESQHVNQANATKWEYKVLHRGGGAMQEHELNAVGAEGWEFVIASPNDATSAAWIFKRPKLQ
jgi:hypothetical protein